MNITNLELSYANLNRSEWQILQQIAREGDEDQRDTLCTWAYTNIPAALYEELVVLCGRGYLLD